MVKENFPFLFANGKLPHYRCRGFWAKSILHLCPNTIPNTIPTSCVLLTVILISLEWTFRSSTNDRERKNILKMIPCRLRQVFTSHEVHIS